MVINRKINRRKPPEEKKKIPEIFSCLGLNRTSDQIEEDRRKRRKKKSSLSGWPKREDGKFIAKRYRKNK